MDAKKYSIRKNAIIGLPNSGKSYRACYNAEQLMDAGIPIVAIDPVGIWYGLKIGVNGNKGYPVVVAGGMNPDLPLTEKNCKEIMRAALKAGVSIVFDLFSMELKTKHAIRNVVTGITEVLLYENKNYGIRHVFIEEAAQFVPQMVGPQVAQVYAEVDSLARMGRNMGIGMTFINQRAEQLNKSVLEICEYSLWFRQEGRNSLKAIQDWFKVRQLDGYEQVVKELPKLKQGQFYAMGDGERPKLIKGEERKTYHPDPNNMEKNERQIKKSAVDVSKFVNELNAILNKQDEEPKTEKGNNKQAPIVSKELEALRFQTKEQNQIIANQAQLIKNLTSENQYFLKMESHYIGYIDKLKSFIEKKYEQINALTTLPLPSFARFSESKPEAKPLPLPKPFGQATENGKHKTTATQASYKSSELGKCARHILNFLLSFREHGFTMSQIAVAIDYSFTSSGFKNSIYSLNSLELIKKEAGRYSINMNGQVNNHIDLKTFQAGTYSVRDYTGNLSKCELEIFRVLVNDPTRAFGLSAIGSATPSNYSITSSGFKNSLYGINTLELVQRNGRGDDATYQLHPDLVELMTLFDE